jgi:hypothetical protein
MFVDFGGVIINYFGSILHWCMVTQSWEILEPRALQLESRTQGLGYLSSGLFGDLSQGLGFLSQGLGFLSQGLFSWVQDSSLGSRTQGTCIGIHISWCVCVWCFHDMYIVVLLGELICIWVLMKKNIFIFLLTGWMCLKVHIVQIFECYVLV